MLIHASEVFYDPMASVNSEKELTHQTLYGACLKHWCINNGFLFPLLVWHNGEIWDCRLKTVFPICKCKMQMCWLLSSSTTATSPRTRQNSYRIKSAKEWHNKNVLSSQWKDFSDESRPDLFKVRQINTWVKVKVSLIFTPVKLQVLSKKVTW